MSRGQHHSRVTRDTGHRLHAGSRYEVGQHCVFLHLVVRSNTAIKNINISGDSIADSGCDLNCPHCVQTAALQCCSVSSEGRPLQYSHHCRKTMQNIEVRVQQN